MQNNNKFEYNDILGSRDKIRSDLKGKSGIYLFVNLKDPTKCYVGSSVNLWNRIRRHINIVNNGDFSKTSKFYNAVNLYKWESFKLVILEFTEDKKLLIAREQYRSS